MKLQNDAKFKPDLTPHPFLRKTTTDRRKIHVVSMTLRDPS
ncbi:hypothetical protein ACKFKG_03330 [Phormidesmis sp. 146-35]